MPSSTKVNSTPRPDLQAVDELCANAGLVRSRRGKPAGVAASQRAASQRMESAESPSLPAALPLVAANGVHWLPLPQLARPGRAKLEWLMGGFSTRLGGFSRAYCDQDAPGELNLGFTASDERETVLDNRRLFVQAVGGRAATPLVTLRQIHSNLLVKAARPDARRQPPRQGDALMTDQPGLLLGIQTADCIPVLVADRKRRVVAAFHAGWRGTVARIVESGIGRLRLEYGCQPEHLIAAIGPGIGPCCYAVGEEMIEAFESQFAYARSLFHEVCDSDSIRRKYPMLFLTQRAPGHSPLGPSLHLDLIQANRRQLLDAGLKENAIQTLGGCTCCQQRTFFSHRGSQGHAGRMLSVIGIRPEAANRR
jgi:hypothetical protein